MRLVVEVLCRENARLLRAAGAGEIVARGTLTAGLLVQGLQDPGVNDVLADLLSNRTGHQLYVTPLTRFRGTLAELEEHLRERGRWLLVGLIDGAGGHRFLPDPTTAIGPGDRVVLFGSSRPQDL